MVLRPLNLFWRKGEQTKKGKKEEEGGRLENILKLQVDLANKERPPSARPPHRGDTQREEG